MRRTHADKQARSDAPPRSIHAPRIQRAPMEGEAPQREGAGGLVVEDDAQTLTAGQMRKSELLELLRVESCAAADRELAEMGRNTEGCPIVERSLRAYSHRSAAQLERAIRRFAPGASSVQSARDYV